MAHGTCGICNNDGNLVMNSLLQYINQGGVEKTLGESSCLCIYFYSFFLWNFGSSESLAGVLGAVQEDATVVHSADSG